MSKQVFFKEIWSKNRCWRIFNLPVVWIVLALKLCRHCEFAHAVMGRLLDGTVRRPQIYYCGVLREGQKDCQASLEAKVYAHWDALETSPPARRPVEPVAEPSLDLLGWVNNAPSFPESVLQKFGEGTPAHQEVLLMQKELVKEFPDAGTQAASAPRQRTTGPTRAAGRPDYSIEGGHAPLDLERLLDKAQLSQQEFEALPRRGDFAKHHFFYWRLLSFFNWIIVSDLFLHPKTWQESLCWSWEQVQICGCHWCWLHNPLGERIRSRTYCGSKRGVWLQHRRVWTEAGHRQFKINMTVLCIVKFKLCFSLPWCYPAGLGEAELRGVCFRFSSDLDFLVYNKKIYCIADFLHYACTVHGVAEVELANHTLTPKMYPVESCLLFCWTVHYRTYEFSCKLIYICIP